MVFSIQPPLRRTPRGRQTAHAPRQTPKTRTLIQVNPVFTATTAQSSSNRLIKSERNRAPTKRRPRNDGLGADLVNDDAAPRGAGGAGDGDGDGDAARIAVGADVKARDGLGVGGEDVLDVGVALAVLR